MFVWGGGTLYNLLNIYTVGEIKGHFPYGGNLLIGKPPALPEDS